MENQFDNLRCGFSMGPDKINMTYEPLYERFEVLAAGGTRLGVKFIRSGFLAQGDRPELFFFQIDGEEAVVGISGASLARFESGRRRLSRVRALRCCLRRFPLRRRAVSQGLSGTPRVGCCPA